MALPDAYASSNGWSGGSPLTNTGALLGNYLQGNQVVNPTTNTLTTATPTTVNTQPSSLSRVVNPSSNAAYTTGEPSSSSSGTTAATATPSATDTATIASQAAATAGVQAGAQIAAQHAALSNPLQTPAVAAIPATGTATFTRGGSLAPSTVPQAANVYANIDPNSLPVPKFSGPATTYFTDDEGIKFPAVFNYATGQWVSSGVPIVPASLNSGANGSSTSFKFTNVNAAIADAMSHLNASSDVTSYQQQLAAYKTAQQQAVTGNQAATSAFQQQQDAASAAAAQYAADQGSAFNLTGKLQAPNTADVDQAGANSLAQVASQYNSGLGGADSGFLGYLGQGAQAQQNATNVVNHDTAYANAFDTNYGTFANALQAQQTAQTNVTGQQMALDVQGISQALSTLQNQAQQLGTQAQSNLNTQLLPLSQALQQYQQAVTQYGIESAQATSFWKTITSLAGTAFSAAVTS